MKRTATWLGAAMLTGIALAAPVWAQGNGQGNQFPGPNGGQFPGLNSGGRPGGGFGYGGGRQGGGGFAMQSAIGSVTAVDAAAGTITITSQMGGNSETIRVGPNAQIMTQATSSVADLKVGDQVQVTGVPTQITASQIVAGQPPPGFGAPGGMGRGGFGGRRQGGFNGGAPGAGGGPDPGATSVTAKVTQTNPLTLAVGNGVSMTVKLAPDTKVSRIKPITLSGVKTADQVFATGQAGSDGSFSATMLAVNMNPGDMGMGRGGFGRGRGGFGRPGQGGPMPGGPGQPMPFPGGQGQTQPMPMPSPNGPQNGAMPSGGNDSVGTEITNGE